MSKPIGYCKAIPRGTCVVINTYNRERKREREKGEDGGRMERRKEKKREGEGR